MTKKTAKNPKGGGRPKGARNKSTERAKLLLVDFVGHNMEEMQQLFDEVREDNPKDAFNMIFGALEYCLPKLSRAEVKAEVEVSLSDKLADMDDI